MKFSCEKALLQSVIATTSRAVASKSSIPALEGLLLQCGSAGLTVSGYNMQTGIRAKVPADITEDGEIVLNARLFGDIVRKMPDDVMTFSSDAKFMVHLACGDAAFDILGLSAADYPELPEVEDQFSARLPQNVLRSGERVFLDDMRLEELEKALQVRVDIVKSSGYDFVNTILDERHGDENGKEKKACRCSRRKT